jgi:hypothetical protein
LVGHPSREGMLATMFCGVLNQLLAGFYW